MNTLYRAAVTLCVLSIICLFVGCAGAENSDSASNGATSNGTTATSNGTTSEEDTGTSVSEDTGNVSEDTNVEPDTAEPDTALPDTNVEDEPDSCGECCNGEVRCGNATTVETCENNMWVASDCPIGRVCRDQACLEPLVECEPGVTECVDSGTQRTCNGSGDGWTPRLCGTGTCIGGSCQTGEPIMAVCEADDACAGGECLCKGDEACPTGLMPTMGDGYCTTQSCDTNGCREDEICMDFSVPGLLTEQNHCVTGCVGCAFNGYACRAVPVRNGDALVWEEACFPEYPKNIGRSCAGDSDCMGGTCLRGGINPENGYCTFVECDSGDNAMRPCPSNSTCVEMEGRGRFCARLCGDGTPASGSCPAEVSNELGLDVSCVFLDEVDVDESPVWTCAPR